MNGVSTIILENVAPMAYYIHCFNHHLNLLIVDSLKNVPKADDFLILLQKLYVFVRVSAVHIKWVDMQKEMSLKPMQLKKLSQTRWAGQFKMCDTVEKRLVS